MLDTVVTVNLNLQTRRHANRGAHTERSVVVLSQVDARVRASGSDEAHEEVCRSLLSVCLSII